MFKFTKIIIVSTYITIKYTETVNPFSLNISIGICMNRMKNRKQIHTRLGVGMHEIWAQSYKTSNETAWSSSWLEQFWLKFNADKANKPTWTNIFTLF